MSAVGTLTITDQSQLDRVFRPVRKITLAWTSTAGGAVSGILTDYLSGALVRVVFVPGAGGVQPTNLYDVTLLDEQGFDVLTGQAANLSNVTTTQLAPGTTCTDGITTFLVSPQIDDRLQLTVANAGNAKSGSLILYLR
jgi:hypothetical protein